MDTTRYKQRRSLDSSEWRNRPRGFDDRIKTALAFVAAAVLVAVVTVALISAPIVGVAIAGLVVLALIIQRLRILVGLAGLALPFAPILIFPVGPVVVPACDILAMLAIASYLMFGRHRKSLEWSPSALGSITRPLAPAMFLFLPYIVSAVLNTAYNFPESGYVVIMQRAEIVVVWLAFGAVISMAGMIQTFLKWYVVACVAVSILWIANPGVGAVFGMQKNSCGGYLIGAVLVVILSGLRDRIRLPLMLLLIAGLVATGSRGSILGISIAVVLFVFFAKQWKRVVLPLLGAVAAGGVAFLLLPDTAQARLISADEAGQFNIDIRGLFVQDAIEQWQVSPWTGIGVGNYRQRADGLQQVLGYDPHNVYVLALTEGGYVHFVAFILLMAGTLIWLMRMPKTSLTVLAITVQSATLVHSYIDVFWVRGTPALGFVLMAAAAAATHRAKMQAPQDPRPPSKPAAVNLAKAPSKGWPRQYSPSVLRSTDDRIRRRYLDSLASDK
jgi:O-antigen ligase